MIRVLIADDQPVVRTGLEMILEAQAGFEVVGQAGDSDEAVALARSLAPDVVLMDIRMPLVDGIEATRRITDARLSTRVLILTTYGLDEYVYDALRSGAAGFVLKTDPPERLVEAVRIVAAGDALLASEITRRLIDRFVSARPSPRSSPQLETLTVREREVLELLARGLTNAEIANKLVVSDGTVKTHVAHVLAKLDLRDRTQAVIYAYEHAIVEPGRTEL